MRNIESTRSVVLNETVQQYMRVFLVGNAVRDHIVPMLFGIELPISNDRNVVIVRDEKNISTEIRTEFAIIQSNHVPYNTLLIVPTNNKVSENMQLGIFDSIFFFDEWTFHNNETLELAKKFRSEHSYCEVKIILCPSKRKTLSTDVSSVQSALQDALAAYERENFTVNILHDIDISDQFFWNKRKYADILRLNFSNRIQQAKRSLDYTYELGYQFLCCKLKEEMLLHSNLDKFTCYEEMAGGRNINQLSNVTAQTFFCKNSQFVTELQTLFKALTRPICLWDEAKVLENLQLVLTRRFRENMELTLPIVSFGGISNAQYEILMNETKFNVKFHQYCHGFFDNIAKNVIKEYIEKMFVRLEGFL